MLVKPSFLECAVSKMRINTFISLRLRLWPFVNESILTQIYIKWNINSRIGKQQLRAVPAFQRV